MDEGWAAATLRSRIRIHFALLFVATLVRELARPDRRFPGAPEEGLALGVGGALALAGGGEARCCLSLLPVHTRADNQKLNES